MRRRNVQIPEWVRNAQRPRPVPVVPPLRAPSRRRAAGRALASAGMLARLVCLGPMAGSARLVRLVAASLSGWAAQPVRRRRRAEFRRSILQRCT